MKTNSVEKILLWLSLLVITILLLSGCFLKRIEQDIYKNIPAGETINFSIEACWLDQCECGEGDTLSGALEDLLLNFEYLQNLGI